MENGIDYHITWDITLAFRGRRCNYETYAKKGGSFTLRETGGNGGKAEIYKMINGDYKSLIYVFVWSCGSYAILDIKKWIKSGLLQEKLKGFKLKNKNPHNKFVAFTLGELRRNNSVIFFHNAKQNRLDSWLKPNNIESAFGD